MRRFSGRGFLVKFTIRRALYTADIIRRNVRRGEIIGSARRYGRFLCFWKLLVIIGKWV